MPRKPNYGLNKHRKEQDRKAKQDAKLREKQQRRADEEQSRPGVADADQSGVVGHIPPDEKNATD